MNSPLAAPEPSDHAAALHGISGVFDAVNVRDEADTSVHTPDYNVQATIDDEMVKVNKVRYTLNSFHKGWRLNPPSSAKKLSNLQRQERYDILCVHKSFMIGLSKSSTLNHTHLSHH